ncbi:MAG: hypothetical protein HY867_20585 [Chloroflexi bacterium]|nr:hypothetical protein [Chloroflexota bacterium]
MPKPLIITSNDLILEKLPFKPYRAARERRMIPFLPEEGQPQTRVIETRSGRVLTVKRGDILISEMDTPEFVWPVDAAIFEASYEVIRPGVCIKRAISWLAPLTELTDGDPDREVTVVSLEGTNTVRAGDYYLAKGVAGEIWAYDAKKVGKIMKPVE